jgi:hypothetical protein
LAEYAKIVSPTFTGTPEAPTAAAGTNTTQIATTAFVMNAVSGVSGPMVYKGTLGASTAGATITSLPSADANNLGFVYKVITEDTYASQACKVGDMWISNGDAWTYIPSGDEAELSMAVTNEVLTFSYSAT